MIPTKPSRSRGRSRTYSRRPSRNARTCSVDEELAMAHHGSATSQNRKCPEPEEETPSSGMCANRCGFFGAAATGNMCSKCYQEHVAAAASDATAEASPFIAPAAASSTAPPEKKAKMTAAEASSDDASASSAVVCTPAPSLKQQQQQQASTAANRCATCRKKVGLLGFRCRCEATFCSVHRYSDKHACGFDYKTADQEKIAKHNPLVVADKIGTRI